MSAPETATAPAAAPAPAATPRPINKKNPHIVVLGGGFAKISSAMAIPKGHAGWLAYIDELVEEAKASGRVNRMIETLAMRGVRVAPPGNLSAKDR